MPHPVRGSTAFALLLGALPAVLQAQTSSVTMFGVVDVSLRYSDNGTATLRSVESGGMTSSRIGVQGVGCKRPFQRHAALLGAAGDGQPAGRRPG